MAIQAFKPRQIDPTANTRMMPPKQPEVVVAFEANQVIFSKGDQGGDLLFIESGSVEIFVTQNEQDIVLATMGPGEIIGVMTFLTKDKRLASARAVTDTTIKKIPSVAIQRFISTFPKWLTIVLKEFVGRINHMNKLYSDSALELKKARELQITSLFLATQFAGAIGIAARALAKTHDPQATVPVLDLSEKLMVILNQPKEMVDNLMAVFLETNLIMLEGDPKLKKIATIASLDQTAYFAQFVRESKQGSVKKIVKLNLSDFELLSFKHLATIAKSKSMVLEKSATLTHSDLAVEMPKLTSAPFDPAVFKKVADLGLVTTAGEVEKFSISFIPREVIKISASLEAYRRFASGSDSF